MGIGGRNPENAFSPLDRGDVRENDPKRKVVWYLVSYLVLAGQ